MTRDNSVAPIERFIEEMGLVWQSGGGPRIAGRLFGLMIVEGSELSLHEISEKLGISRASASTNARLLARRGILRLTAHAGNRQDYYALTASPHSHFMEEAAAEMERNATTMEDCADQIGPVSRDVAERVRGLGDFYRRSADFLKDWAETLRLEEQTARRTERIRQSNGRAKRQAGMGAKQA